MSESVKPLSDPPPASAALPEWFQVFWNIDFLKWWSGKFKPDITKEGRLPWSLTDKTGAVASDVGAPSLAAFTAHTAATSAHGASGNIIGTGNAASAGTRGAVFRGVAVADPATSSAQSTATTTSADAAAQTVAYVQADVQSIATLANELKTDHNALVTAYNALQTDHAATRAQLVALLTSLESAGVIAT